MIKYAFYDDETNKGQGFANSFNNKKEGILTEYVIPEHWEKVIESIKQKLNDENYDGLILDLRLDRELDNKYKGNTLAQEVRNLATLGEIKDCPIILYSGPDKLQGLYDIDDTSHNLFDAKFIKGDLGLRESKNARNILKSLATGYLKIREDSRVSSILKIDNKQIDYRIKEKVESLQGKKVATHEYARFILTYIIQSPGVLINENILAARLGVDVDRSADHWTEFKTQLKSIEYKGVFYEAYPRWWANSLISWWENIFDHGIDTIANLDANERISALNNKFNLQLIPAEKTTHSSSNYFWTICIKSLAPIAIEDGILANEENLNTAPWLDDSYYSIDEALKIESSKISSIDRDRVSELMDIINERK